MFLPIMYLFITASIVGIVLYEVLSPFGMNSAYNRLWKSARLTCGTKVSFIVALYDFEMPAKSFKFLRDIGYEILDWSDFENLVAHSRNKLSCSTRYVIYEPLGDRQGIWIVAIEPDAEDPNGRTVYSTKITSVTDIKGCCICAKETNSVSIFSALKNILRVLD